MELVMKSILSAMFLLLPALTFAQYKPISEFNIGTGYVNMHSGCDGYTYRISNMNDLNNAGVSIWDELLDLGITMPEFYLHSSFINNADMQDNPRALLLEAGQEGLKVGFLDDYIYQASVWERRYFQVEALEHFATRYSGRPDKYSAFQLGTGNSALRYDVHPLYMQNANSFDNCIYFDKDEDADAANVAISGFTQRDSLFADTQYYVSVRLARNVNEDEPLSTDTTSVLWIRLYGGDGPADSSMVWKVPACALRNSVGGAPFEYLLQHRDGTINNNPNRATITIHNDSTSTYHRRYGVLHNFKEQWGLSDTKTYSSVRTDSCTILATNTLKMEITYLGIKSIYLDAICFSDPQAFDLFTADDSSVFKRLDKPRHLYDTLRERLGFLGVNSTSNNPLRYIRFHERGTSDGSLPTMNYIDKIIKELSGDNTILTFNYAGPATGFDDLIRQNYNVVTAFYQYPSTCQLPSPCRYDYYGNAYHCGGFMNYGWISRNLRNSAISLKNYYGDQSFNYFPAVQNHSHHFIGRYITCGSNTQDMGTDQDREPTTTEMRVNVNLSLCYGAKSFTYFMYTSFDANGAADSSNNGRWNNLGNHGFINTDAQRRTDDIWSENKWERARDFNKNYLMKVKDSLYALRWENAYPVNENLSFSEYSDPYISAVVSVKPDSALKDDQNHTFVEVGRFSHPSNLGAIYLYIVNKRSRPLDGRRILVKLKGSAHQYQVRDLVSKDTWYVFPYGGLDPDTTRSEAFSFASYYQPGEAKLFRVLPRGSILPKEEYCDYGDKTFTEGGTWSFADCRICLDTGKIIVEGDLQASNTEFTNGTLEPWSGIIVRNGGRVDLSDNCHIMNAGVHIGPTSNAAISGTKISNTSLALDHRGDTLISTNCIGDTITGNGSYLKTYGAGFFSLIGDSAVSYGGGYAGIDAENSVGNLRNTRLYGFSYGFVGNSSTVQTAPVDSGSSFSHLKLDAANTTIYADGADLDFGTIHDNSFLVQNPGQGGLHVDASNGSWILAQQCYWNPGGLSPAISLQSGAFLDWSGQLQDDPMPFAPISTRLESFSGSADQSTTSFEEAMKSYRSRFVRGDFVTAVNNIKALFGRSEASQLSLGMLRWISRVAERTDNDSLRTALMQICLSRSDLHTKLIAAEIEARQGAFQSALNILNSYSFSGSERLLKESLLLKAMWLPQAYRGGYTSALSIIDSLKQFYSIDSSLVDFVKYYPLLYSGLTLNPGGRMRKTTELVTGILLPSAYDIRQNYPNPSNKITSFTFKIPEASRVNLTIHDALGRKVYELVNADYTSGTYSVVMNTATMPPGMYFYRFTAGDKVVQKKMVVVR
jgi:hypothetical protein